VKRKLVALFIVIAAALTLSGCVVFLIGGRSSTQQNVVGSVEIDSAVCASDKGHEDHLGCDDGDVEGGNARGNSNSDAPTSDGYQVLLGYRVPTGSEGPASFTSDAPTGPLTFTRSASYESELQRLAPAPAGQHWVGYLSNEFSYDSTTPGVQSHRLYASPEFSLPRGGDGSPFQGPFSWQHVVGFRLNSSSQSPDAPINCGSSLMDGTTDPVTGCADAPALATIGDNLSQPTRDLGILSGAAVSSSQGKTAPVPFTAKYAGASTADANFTLSATTSVPGGTASPSQPSLLPPADSSTPVSVAVKVPKATPPGTYSVTLTAGLANGQTRSNTRNLVVSDKTAPTTTVGVVPGQSVRSVLAHGLRLRIRLSEAGRVTDDLSVSSGLLARSVRVARKTTSFARAGRKTVRLKLSRKARKRRSAALLLHPRKVSFSLRATAKDKAGNRRTTRKRIRLKRG
jgi:hypothetical protein